MAFRLLLQNNYIAANEIQKSIFFFAIHSRVFSTHRLPLIGSERVSKHEEPGHQLHRVEGVRGLQPVSRPASWVRLGLEAIHLSKLGKHFCRSGLSRYFDPFQHCELYWAYPTWTIPTISTFATAAVAFFEILST